MQGKGFRESDGWLKDLGERIFFCQELRESFIEVREQDKIKKLEDTK